MPIRRTVALLALSLLLLLPRVTPPAEAQAAQQPLTIMSFNIRYGTANDGENRWAARRSLLMAVVRRQNADLIGLQEALDFQIREIVAALPGFAVVGVGRDDGKSAGEYAAILYRRNRFHVAEAGTFWFSDTPSVPGSRSWGNRITRICTWARFVDRDGSAFWHYNVHLDHESQPSRMRSTELLASRVRDQAGAEPVLITGDFNVGEDNPALRALTAPEEANGPRFLDTFRVLYPEVGEAGTFSGFKFGQTRGPKIDYVLVQPGVEVLRAAIVRTSRNKRYPSDHFPVVARVRLEGD